MLVGRTHATAASFACAFAAVLAYAPSARAQLHGDVAIGGGVTKRFLANRPASGDAGFGPAGQVTGHVALFPLLYGGAYFGHDVSPLPNNVSARNITSFGVRAKGFVPLVRGDARAWIFLGFGYAVTYQQSYGSTFTIDQGGGPQQVPVHVEGAGGSFFEVPVGLGASYKLRKPVSLFAELGGRVGFGHVGSVYTLPGPQATVSGFLGQNAAPAGVDRFAIELRLGVQFDL